MRNSEESKSAQELFTKTKKEAWERAEAKRAATMDHLERSIKNKTAHISLLRCK